MLGNNIKELRKKQGMSQEQLAQKLYVVRQTISKWENGSSVPNADELISLAEVLQVSVNELLGVENNELENMKEREKRLIEAGKVRGYILMLAFASVILTFALKNTFVAIAATAVCCITALIILYNNLGLLTFGTVEDSKLKPLKITTVFNISLIVVCAVLAALIKIDIVQMSQNGEKYFAALIVNAIILFTGYIAPKLPFNRHTGMRLPWTVTDEETWNLAHQILGITAIPTGVVYIGLVAFIDNFEVLTATAILIWIGFPAGISLIYFWRKFHRR